LTSFSFRRAVLAASASDARLRSETRKYALSVTLVTQFLDALSNDARAALLGNAKTLVASA